MGCRGDCPEQNDGTCAFECRRCVLQEPIDWHPLCGTAQEDYIEEPVQEPIELGEV